MDIVVDVERTFFGVVKAKVLFAERIVLIKEDFGLWLLLRVLLLAAVIYLFSKTQYLEKFLLGVCICKLC